MDRATKGTVVIEARLGSGGTVDFDIQKNAPARPPEGTTRWYARYSGPEYTTSTGRRTTRYRKPLGTDMQAAWNAARGIQLQLNAVKLGQTLPELPAKSKTSKPSIASAIAEFVSYSEGRVADWRSGADNGLAPNSLSAYKKAMENFAASCAEMGAINMAEFQNEERGEAILHNFKKWLDKNVVRRSGKPAHSNSKKFTVIGQFLARNGFKMKTDRIFNPNDVGLMDRVDVPRVKKPKTGDVVFYTPADLAAMMKATETIDKDKGLYTPAELKTLVLLFLTTGMRDEEIQHLEWSDINWKNGDGRGKITIQDKPQYDWRVKDHEKRIVTMTDQLRVWLKAHYDNTSRAEVLIFPTSVGTPNQNFADQINGLQARAIKAGYTFSRPEAQKKTLHNFRRTYATMQSLHGIPSQNIKDDMGHSDLETTERYLGKIEDPDKTRKDYASLLSKYAKPMGGK